MLINLLYINIG